MEKDKLRELIKNCIDEISGTAGAGGFLGQVMVKKSQKESTTKAFTRNPARPVTNQDKNSPSGFESMPDSAKVYIKGGFKAIKPEDRLNSKDLWKGNHLEETIAVVTPKAFRKPKKQHETSKSGHEDLPNIDKHFELVKFKIVEPKEEQLNEVRYSQFKNETKNRTPQQQLHEGVKKIQRNLDEINKLVEFVTRMKNELKGDASNIDYLKRTHNSLFKINDKIQQINNKIKDLTE